jgi:hypothetical protein
MFAHRLETQPFARNMIGTFAEPVGAWGGESAGGRCRLRAGHLTAMRHDPASERGFLDAYLLTRLR